MDQAQGRSQVPDQENQGDAMSKTYLHRMSRRADINNWTWRTWLAWVPERKWWPIWIDDQWWHKLWCWAIDHDPIQDHCGMPDHDLCAWCGKSMPSQAKRYPPHVLKLVDEAWIDLSQQAEQKAIQEETE